MSPEGFDDCRQPCPRLRASVRNRTASGRLLVSCMPRRTAERWEEFRSGQLPAAEPHRHLRYPRVERMNLTDRIYLAVHVFLTVLVCALHQRVPHWPAYVAWNVY